MGVKADKETLKYLKIQNPLMQQRILDARDLVLNDPQIGHRVMTQCQKTSAMEMVQIVKELDAVKEEVAELQRDQNEVVSGELHFSPSWSNYGGSYEHGKWFKIGRLVGVQGLVKSSDFANKREIARLPEGCRPGKTHIFSLDHHGSTFRVDVFPDGRISWIQGSNTYSFISLSGIVFVVE